MSNTELQRVYDRFHKTPILSKKLIIFAKFLNTFGEIYISFSGDIHIGPKNSIDPKGFYYFEQRFKNDINKSIEDSSKFN